MSGLLISQALLWAAVILLAVVCLALARQLGVLYERIAPAGALAMNQRLRGGDPAPASTVVDIKGQPLAIAEANNKGQCQLLFFLSPSCPVCKTLLPVLKAMRQQERAWLQIILASDGDDTPSHQSFIEQQGLEAFSYVLSEPLGMGFGVSKLPYGVLIDETGTISALGMINSREHLESLFEAKRLGQASIQDYLQAQNDREDNFPHPTPIAALSKTERSV